MRLGQIYPCVLSNLRCNVWDDRGWIAEDICNDLMIFLVGGGCAEGATWAKQGVIKRDANFLSYLAHCNLEGDSPGSGLPPGN